MGQGYSSTVRDGDIYLDHGDLDQAEAKFLTLHSQAVPAHASDETLMIYASCKLQASMNLGLICMCRGQHLQAEKYMGEAAQLEVRHSNSQRQHHVNTLAIFYLAATSCLSPKPESEHLLQRIITSPFVVRALEARAEHATLIACSHAWLLFLLDRPLSVVLAPLLRIESTTSRIVYNTPDSVVPTINFEIDGELEGVELGDDEIGDIPSDDDNDDDGLTGATDDDATTSPKKRKDTPTSPNGKTGSSSSAPPTTEPTNYLESKSRRPSPMLELVKAIALTGDSSVETIQVQALAQAARAMGMEAQRTVYGGVLPVLYSMWRDRGYALQKLGRHQASLVPFMIALACNWTYLEAWVDLAQAYSHAGDDQKARRYLALLTDVIAPNDSIGWMERSRICLKSGKYAEAAMCCDRVTLDIDPQNIEAWERRAFCTLQLRRWNSRAIFETLELTDTALALNPFHVSSLRTKACALIECGRNSEASTAIEVLLQHAPHDSEVLLAKATLLRHLRQYDEAIFWGGKALAANPHSADVALQIALCYFQMASQVDFSKKTSTSSTSSHSHPASAASSASSSASNSTSPGEGRNTPTGSSIDSPSLRNSGALSNSMSCDPSLMPDGTFVGTLPFNQADSIEYPNMLTVMAHLHSTPNMSVVNQGLEATEVALDIATRYPEHDGPSHFYFEPSALPRTKDDTYADDQDQMLKLQNQFVKSQIWATRALLLAHSHRTSEALTAADHAIEEAPECPAQAYIAKGDVLQMADKPAEEIHSLYLKALESDPQSEFALLSLVHFLLSKGEGKEALKYSTRLAKLADDGVALNTRLAIEVHASTLFHVANYDAAYQYCMDNVPKLADDSETHGHRRHKNIHRTPRASLEDTRVSNNATESTGEDTPHLDEEDDPYHVRLLNIAAQSLHQLGRCDEAQSLFDRSLRPDPMNVYTWNEKARCLLQNRRFDDALNYLDRALVLDPDDVRTTCNRALCICLLGNIEEGADTLSQMEKGPNHKEASEWLQSLSPTERAYHFDSLTAARELKKRRDREASAQAEERSDEM